MDAALQAAINAGYVRCQRHPDAPLTIYNYTEQCQYKRAWDDTTLAARGLILHDDGTIFARGFRKFFNLGECQEPPPAEPFKVFDKLDGSLGILYTWNGKPAIATRGSFFGEQAVKATEICRSRYRDYRPPAGTTAVLEIIYPQNRIVVNYGDTEDLFHLALVDNGTGLPRFDPDPAWPGPTVKEFQATAITELMQQTRPNAEGYVVRFKGGLQVKVKYEEYVRIHKLIFQTSTRTIWEHLAAGGNEEELIAGVPDELFPFIREHYHRLLQQFLDLEAAALADFTDLAPLAIR